MKSVSGIIRTCALAVIAVVTVTGCEDFAVEHQPRQAGADTLPSAQGLTVPAGMNDDNMASSAPGLVPVEGAMGQQAATEFRSLGHLGSVCNWDNVEWNNMTADEQHAWMVLGWSKERWESSKSPESSQKDWDELTPRQQTAARNLNYNERTWNGDCKGLF